MKRDATDLEYFLKLLHELLVPEGMGVYSLSSDALGAMLEEEFGISDQALLEIIRD